MTNTPPDEFDIVITENPLPPIPLLQILAIEEAVDDNNNNNHNHHNNNDDMNPNNNDGKFVTVTYILLTLSNASIYMLIYSFATFDVFRFLTSITEW